MKQVKPLRIAFITCHFPPDSIGGAQVQSLRLSNALGKLCDVTVYVRDYQGNAPGIEHLKNFTIIRRRVSRIPVVRSVQDTLKTLQFIRRNRGKFDLFLSFHLQLAALVVVLGKKFFNVKSLISPRGYEDFNFSPWYKKYFQKYLYQNASAILIQSEAIKQKFVSEAKNIYNAVTLKKIADRIYLFPNLIEEATTENRREYLPSRLIFVGRLVDYKGVQYLLEAVRKLSVPYELLIVGDGPYRSVLQKSSNGLNVRFTGEVPLGKVQEYVGASSVFVLPSLTENLPNVVLEALAAGIPVIASAVGALPEIIQDGKNGFLVPPKDSNCIAERLERILSDRMLRETMSRAARESIRAFTAENVAPHLETVLREVAER
jgi:glycosyltransferase involved in cell wall biosynthesis